MSKITEIMESFIDGSYSCSKIHENNCGLKVPDRFHPSVIYKFNQSMAQNKIQLGIHSKLPDFVFACNGFDSVGCLVLIELSKGRKSVRKVRSQLQSGFAVLEKIVCNMSEGERRYLDKVKKFAVYCGNYDIHTHRNMRKRSSSKIKKKNVPSTETDDIKFLGYKVKFRKCNCDDSISVIESNAQ